MKYGPEVGRAAVALFLAGSLWLVVSAEETTAEWVSVRVALDLDATIALAEAPPTVRAYVVGRRRDLFKLISSPPTFQRAITEDDRDSVRVELRAQDLDMPAGTDISVRDLRPRLLTFRLKRRDATSQSGDTSQSSRRADSATYVVPPDTVLDSIARAKLISDSIAAAAAFKRDSVLPPKTRKPPL
ncbi:MAG: hypothetical protein ABJB74_23095 [Gemmatimonas sp.]